MLIVIVALYIIVFLLTWLKKSSYSWMLLLTALLMQGWNLVNFTLQTHHLPVFTPAASLMLVAFILGLTTFFISMRTVTPLPGRRWAILLTIILLAAALLWPQAPPCFDYNHIYPYAVAFHVFRRLALAAALFATALFLSTFSLNVHKVKEAAIARHQGRTALLAATVFYLLSEDTGIIWCLNGWADVWRWTPGFIISSMVIMFLMLILHLPGGSLKNNSWYTILGLSCGPLMFIAQFYKP